MSHNKGGLSTTMNDGFHKEGISETPAGNHTMDHNSCPYFSKPREHGGIPEVFFATVEGRGSEGHPGKDAAVSSTMGSSVSKKS